MPLPLQVKLLRALQERVVVRVGDTDAESVDIRVVAATNRELEAEIKTGRFREDLYYRLNVVHLHLPPLRERGDDIVVLARYMLGRYAPEYGNSVRGLTPNAIAAIKRHRWPGNIRELENRIKKAVVLADKALLGPEDLDLSADDLPPILPLAEAKEKFQRDYINEVLELQQRQPHQDRPRPGRRSAHDLPPPGEGRRHRPRRARRPERTQRTPGALMPVARCRARCPLVFAMLAAWAAGCVVPVGPQFQDPLAAQNFAPRITYTDPPEGRQPAA